MNKTEKFPIGHVVGFLLSIALTFLALILVEYTSFSKTLVYTLISVLAIFQAGLQLFSFMHMSEGKDGWAKVTHTIYAIIMAVIIVVGTIFVMTAGHPIH